MIRSGVQVMLQELIEPEASSTTRSCALGADTGISKSKVSRICADLDADVAAFADRSLADAAFPYVYLDATYSKARVGGGKGGKGSCVASQAVVGATGSVAATCSHFGISRRPRRSPCT